MNILFVVTGLAMGGAENQVVHLADHMAARGYKVTIAYIIEPRLVEPHLNQVDLVWLGGEKSIFGMLKAYINLNKLVRKLKPDVLHSHMYHANILSRCIRISSYVPRLICTAHSINEGGRLRMLIYRVTDRLADEFTNVSKEAVKSFERNKAAPRGRMIVTYNGIDTQKFRFNQNSRKKLRSDLGVQCCKVFISIGRFHEAKDYPNLLRAFSMLSASHPSCHLLIVGDGEQRPLIEEAIAVLGLKGKVTLLGVRKDIPDLLSAADVFVLSSAWEGLPLVIGEAMACERVVITTDAGGAREFLVSDEYLVSTRCSAELRDSMIKAVSITQETSALIGSIARERIEELFDIRRIVEKWLTLYK